MSTPQKLADSPIPVDLPRVAGQRPWIMGILNVTPDSFSDGSRHVGVEAAARHGVLMAELGADIIDVGGESTRPGSQPVDAGEQARRTAPVIERLRCELDAIGPAGKRVRISIDTTRSDVARAALDAGAWMINDVSAGRDDAEMLPLAARTGVALVLMHMQGTPATMQANPTYGDVVSEVEAFLLERAQAARAAGVAAARIVLDPGIGFGKTKAHNLALLAALPRLCGHGYAVLLGTSRKRFMGAICSAPMDGATPTPEELVGATCATTALGVAAGAGIFRVHDVRENRQAADVAWVVGLSEGR